MARQVRVTKAHRGGEAPQIAPERVSNDERARRRKLAESHAHLLSAAEREQFSRETYQRAVLAQVALRDATGERVSLDDAMEVARIILASTDAERLKQVLTTVRTQEVV